MEAAKEEKLIDSETMETVGTSTVKDWTFQNRDVIKWMDRIERGAEYRKTAEDILSIVGRIASDVSKEVFLQQWKANYETHESPRGTSVDADIKSPIIKKIHNKDDKEKHFIYYKDYPFYYVWNIFDVFSILPDGEKMQKNQEYYKQWYMATLSEKIQSEILRLLKKEVDRKLPDVFEFPKGKDDFRKNRINIVVSSSLRFSAPNEKKPQIALFRASKDYADMVVNELSIAIGRILNPTEDRNDGCGQPESDGYTVVESDAN